MAAIAIPPHKEHDVTLSSGDVFRVVVFGSSDEGTAQFRESFPPVIFCVHGAGMSSSSFYTLAARLLEDSHSSCGETPVTVLVVAFDMRCHGDSTARGGEESLTLQVLVEDFRAVLRAVKESLFANAERFYFVGHSLGGSVLVHGLLGEADLLQLAAGVVLLDVVEGTARISLGHMDKFLENRPQKFREVSEATQWFLQRGGMRNAAAAEVTVPPLLRMEGEFFVWKSNLERMSSVWPQWFDGLDKGFVALPCPKILCLANTERLDTALTIAQMQGKFQLEVLGNGCGHYVMDDQPHAVSLILHRFIRRIETLSEKLKATLRKPSG
uniref:Protein phosphatase methylesterase 1 n=1 Tax=Trypanosoma congolense (strain IL3000) TaxID=1068625 RepID=G0V2Q8_TRYCI|nr:unnamed protein product [Trypanosoma congolense IL3000]